MTYKEVMAELESFANPSTKKTLMRHGAKEPFWGVKVGDMKKIQKKIKKDHELALQLYDSGNSDAMYFAGLIEDEAQVTEKQLEDWLKKAYWYYLSEFTVPWLAADAGLGEIVGKKWIESKDEKTAAAGWQAFSAHLLVTPNDELDIKYYDKVLDRIEKDLQTSGNRVKHTMNALVIAIGTNFEQLTAKAIKIGNNIGLVKVNMGDTACKVPSSPAYIEKAVKMGRIGRKKKIARC